MTDRPGVADPTVPATDDPPSLSVFVIERFDWAVKASESVALTGAASEAEAVAVFT